MGAVVNDFVHRFGTISDWPADAGAPVSYWPDSVAVDVAKPLWAVWMPDPENPKPGDVVTMAPVVGELRPAADDLTRYRLPLTPRDPVAIAERRRAEEERDAACDPHQSVQDWDPMDGTCRRCYPVPGWAGTPRDAGDHFVHWVHAHFAEWQNQRRRAHVPSPSGAGQHREGNDPT